VAKVNFKAKNCVFARPDVTGSVGDVSPTITTWNTNGEGGYNPNTTNLWIMNTIFYTGMDTGNVLNSFIETAGSGVSRFTGGNLIFFAKDGSDGLTGGTAGNGVVWRRIGLFGSGVYDILGGTRLSAGLSAAFYSTGISRSVTGTSISQSILTSPTYYVGSLKNNL
jgi:hypothetical protein